MFEQTVDFGPRNLTLIQTLTYMNDILHDLQPGLQGGKYIKQQMQICFCELKSVVTSKNGLSKIFAHPSTRVGLGLAMLTQSCQ